MAYRLTGSPDLYEHDGRRPYASINFVTAHDGFTLEDLVSYDQKHNEANLESNRDGSDNNRSWNCGAEGPTDNPAIASLREKQKRNLLATLLFSQGVPMLVAGDELGRTQRGNNNAYCHDDEASWFDWTLLERHGDMRRFVESLISHRLHLVLTVPTTLGETLADFLREAHIEIHGVKRDQPDWSHESHSLAVTEYDAYPAYYFSNTSFLHEPRGRTHPGT